MRWPHAAIMKITAAFGPQHGLRGDKQDNMVESPDFNDPVHGIPVFSLYGEVRKPTDAMMDAFDVLLVDLQDLGCRIYTFITTLRYVLEAAAQHRKAVWVLDRPNPVGRPVEGLTLRAGWESFVGAGPLPMRHGLTLGELGQWFVRTLKLDVEYRVIEMQGWQPDAAPGFGWPLGERTWINPSPNAPNLWMARAYAGTVMLEGTTLSEGRGTTRPLELFGAPDLDARAVMNEMAVACAAVARRLPPARMLVRADVSQACRASFAMACRSTRKVPTTITRRSGHGASRRSLSKRSAACIRTIRCGAISPTSTSTVSSPSMSSTAGRCCESGSTMHRRHRRTWMHWRGRMNRHGRASASHTCATLRSFSACRLPSTHVATTASSLLRATRSARAPAPARRARCPGQEIARG